MSTPDSPEPPPSGLERLRRSFFSPSRGQAVVAALVALLAFAANVLAMHVVARTGSIVDFGITSGRHRAAIFDATFAKCRLKTFRFNFTVTVRLGFR